MTEGATESGDSDGWVLILGRHGFPEISSGLNQAVHSTLWKLKAKQNLTILDIGEVGSGEVEYMAMLKELTGATRIVRRDPTLSFLPTFQQALDIPGTSRNTSGAGVTVGPYQIVVLDEYEHLWQPVAGGDETHDPEGGQGHDVPEVELIPPPAVPANTTDVIYVHRNDAWNVAREKHTRALLVRCPSLTRTDFLLNGPKGLEGSKGDTKEYAGGLLLLDLAERKIYQYEWWLDPNSSNDAKDLRPRCQVYDCPIE